MKAKRILSVGLALMLAAVCLLSPLPVAAESVPVFSGQVQHSVTADDEVGNGLAFSFTLDAAGVKSRGTRYTAGTGTLWVEGASYPLKGMGAVVTNRLGAIPVREEADGRKTVDVTVQYVTDVTADSVTFAVRVVGIPDVHKGADIAVRPYAIYEKDGADVVVYGAVNTANYQAAWDAAHGNEGKTKFAVSSTMLSAGDNAVSLDPAAVTTLYTFRPEETGVYTISVAGGLTLSTWSWSLFTETDAYREGFFLLEVKNVGPSYRIGLSGVAAHACISIVKTGESAIDPAYYPYLEHAELHSPPAAFTMATEDKAALVGVDVTVPQTAVLAADGYYHLGSANGPLLYVNLNKAVSGINLQEAWINGAFQYYQLDEQGKVQYRADGHPLKYTYYTCFEAYTNASDGGLYPLNEELAYILQQQAAKGGWAGHVLGSNPDSVWLNNCFYVPT